MRDLLKYLSLGWVIDKLREIRIPSIFVLVGWIALLVLIIRSEESWVWEAVKEAWSEAGSYVREVSL